MIPSLIMTLRKFIHALLIAAWSIECSIRQLQSSPRSLSINQKHTSSYRMGSPSSSTRAGSPPCSSSCSAIMSATTAEYSCKIIYSPKLVLGGGRFWKCIVWKSVEGSTTPTPTLFIRATMTTEKENQNPGVASAAIAKGNFPPSSFRYPKRSGLDILSQQVVSH